MDLSKSQLRHHITDLTATTEVTATMGLACLQNGGHRLPKIALYGELLTGYRDRGASKKRSKDSLKKTLGTCHIDHQQWSTLAADHQVWRYTVHQVVFTFEDSCRGNLREKHRWRKIQGASTASICRCLPPDTTWHKVKSPKAN